MGKSSGMPSHESVVAELMRRELGLNRLEASATVSATREKCSRSLVGFVEEAWHVLEPRQRYVHGWLIEAICDHLEAVTAGLITRLLINVPPGSAKSLLVSVMWPAWEWGPKGLTSYRYISSSFAESAVVRDVRKTRMLVTSDWYQRHWPHVELVRHGELSFENTLTGTRDGVAFGSLTSRRGDRLILDDPHSVEKAESQVDREKATRRFRESAVNRLNDQAKSAIVVIMQRLHEADISGVIQEYMPDYTQVVLPMEYESGRHCETEIGFSDPRSSDGELLFPARWGRDAVDKLKRDMEKFAWAGQYQQRPAPRGGGIFPYNGWELWHRGVSVTYGRNESQYPDMDMIVGSLDSAYGEKQESDYSAFAILGVWTNHRGVQQGMLMGCWQKRLPISELVNEILKSCRKLKVDRILVEGKASGISVIQELRRLMADSEFGITQIDPKPGSDKVARGHAISHLWGEEEGDGSFRKGVMWVPCQTQTGGAIWPRDWAELAMSQMSSFPKGKHDDIPDAVAQAVKFLRDRGMLKKSSEVAAEEYAELTRPPQAAAPLYPI